MERGRLASLVVALFQEVVNMTSENQQEHLQIAPPLFAPMHEQSNFHGPIEFSPHLRFLLLYMICDLYMSTQCSWS